MPHDLPNRWVWILDVLFGGILTLAFQTLSENLDRAWDTSPATAARLASVGFCLFVFFLYDVIVYHYLVRRFPYRTTGKSAGRYLLDVVMAFLLLKAVVSGMYFRPEITLATTLLALTLWHLCAAAWHCLASWDEDGRFPPMYALLPHFMFAAGYWLVLGLVHLVARTAFGVTDLRHPSAAMALGATVLAVSLYRSRQLLTRLGHLEAQSEPGPSAPPSGPAADLPGGVASPAAG